MKAQPQGMTISLEAVLISLMASRRAKAFDAIRISACMVSCVRWTSSIAKSRRLRDLGSRVAEADGLCCLPSAPSRLTGESSRGAIDRLDNDLRGWLGDEAECNKEILLSARPMRLSRGSDILVPVADRVTASTTCIDIVLWALCLPFFALDDSGFASTLVSVGVDRNVLVSARERLSEEADVCGRSVLPNRVMLLARCASG